MTIVADLSARIGAREARVGVIGLGYVGLPLTLAFAEANFPVLGFDIDRAKVDKLNAGTSYIHHIPSESVERLVAAGKLAATDDPARLAEVDAALICVPTPLDSDRQPDLSFVVETARQMATALRAGQLVVLESTTYPGTTEEVVLPLLEESGLRCGRDFFLAYSPEREDPGNPEFETRTIPKVIGGYDDTSRDLAQQLYGEIIVNTLAVSGLKVAEASKLTENIFRAVNIALVNELKMVYDAMGIDVWEVLDAASTKPFGFMRFDPGPGWGGHCIPVDPFYLSWKASQHGAEARFIELAGRVNTEMPRWVTAKLEEALADRSTSLAGSPVLVVGLAYKRDVADPRESPAFELISLLQEKGAKVSYHDPLIPQAPSMRSWEGLAPLNSITLDDATLEAQAAVIIATDHSFLDYDLIQQHAPLVIDARGVYRGAGDFPNVVSA